jgi:mono/diheme cytochrome c family protein
MKIPSTRSYYFLPLLALVLSACSFSLAEDITPPPGAVQAPIQATQTPKLNGPLYPLVPPNPQDGQSIYIEKCAPCHGATGMGDGPRAAQLPNPVPALGAPEVARQATPSRWYTMVTQGNLERFMPPFASLSDRQRWDVVAYALSLSASPALAEQGAALYQDNCAGCHGEKGMADGPQAAGLPVKPTDFTNQELMAQKSAVDFFQAMSAGAAPAMPAFANQLSDDERWALTAYLRSLTFAQGSSGLATGVISGTVETPSTTGEADGALATPLADAAGVFSGSIAGSVINASGGEVPAGLEVTLRGFDQMLQVITQTTTLQPDGSFTFDGVEMPAGRAFMTTVDFQDTIYGSDIAVAEGDNQALQLPISIYETTTDASVLKADRLHIFFEFGEGNTVRVIQLYILSNPSNKTLVPPGEGEPTVSFELPEGAANLEFQDGTLGERFIKTEKGFGDTIPIRPGLGNYELLYAFEMPYERKLELVQPLSLPVDAVVVMVPDSGIKVKGDALVDTGTRDVQGAQYRLFNGGSLSAGSDLRLTLSGRPTSGAPQLTAATNTNLAIGLGVFGIALVIAGVFLYRRSRISQETIEPVEEDGEAAYIEPNGGSAESLMDAIIALDDLYQAGELPEAAYLERRAILKQRLRELTEK